MAPRLNASLQLIIIAILPGFLSLPVAGQEEQPSLEIADLKVEPAVLELVEGQNGTVTVSMVLHNRGNVTIENLYIRLSLEPAGPVLVSSPFLPEIGPGETYHINDICRIGPNVAAGSYNLTAYFNIIGTGVETVQVQNFTIVRLKQANVEHASVSVLPKKVDGLKSGQKARFQVMMIVLNEGDLNGTFNISIFEKGKTDKPTFLLTNRTVTIRPKGNWTTTLNWSTTAAGHHDIIGEVRSLNGTLVRTTGATCVAGYVNNPGANGPFFPNELAMAFGLMAIFSFAGAVVIIFLARRHA
jgi:hypothetical protein